MEKDKIMLEDYSARQPLLSARSEDNLYTAKWGDVEFLDLK